MPDGQIFVQPWLAEPTESRRDQTMYYQYKDDRARRILRGINEQIAKAEKAVAGQAAVKRNRFVRLSGGTRTVNRDLEARSNAVERAGGGPKWRVYPRLETRMWLDVASVR